jgi:hypothetical protein
MSYAHDWVLQASLATLENEFIKAGYTPEQAATMTQQWQQAIEPKTEGE